MDGNRRQVINEIANQLNRERARLNSIAVLLQDAFEGLDKITTEIMRLQNEYETEINRLKEQIEKYEKALPEEVKANE